MYSRRTLQPSYLWYSVLGTLAVLVSQDSEFCLHNSGNQLGLGFLFVPSPGNYLKDIYWYNCRAHVIYLHSNREHQPSLPDVQCLENYCEYFVHFCLCFRQEKENQSGPCDSILAGSVSFLFVLITEFWNCESLIPLLNLCIAGVLPSLVTLQFKV